METKYFEKNGTSFSINTNNNCANILNELILTKKRVRLFYGEQHIGEDWCERFDTIGYIGRSNGKIKIPILLSRKDSSGGFPILTDCILKIVETRTNKILYLNKKYLVPNLEIVKQNKDIYSLTQNKINGEKIVLFVGNKEKCEREKEFFVGKRNKV